MRYSKYNKNYRFSYFLPYNAISPLALELAIDPEDDSYLDYHPNKSMSERLASCNRGHNIRLKKIQTMVKSGYIEIVNRSSGPDKDDTIRVARLTKAGFYYLAGKILPQHEIDDIQLKEDDENDLVRFMLNSLAENDYEQFTKVVEEEIFENRLSILATESSLASEVRITPSTQREVLYRNWVLGNVQALFVRNGYVTILDRFPMPRSKDTDLSFNVTNKPPLTVEQFTRYTLSRWYNSHPLSNKYHDPYEYSSDEAIASWWSTPAFYPVSEIPGFDVQQLNTENSYRRKHDYNHHRSFIGLAAGKTANYLVYYEKANPTKWNIKAEYNSIQRVEEALKNAYTWVEHPHMYKNCNYAVIVCHSVLHFKALFKETQNRMGTRTGSKRNVSAPFNTICIITLNHAGLMQTRMLMTLCPQDIDNTLIFEYTDRYDSFRENPYDNTYRLTYNGTPVLLAHTMDFQKLFTAMEDYERGAKFYVLCFPQQVKFIQQIMPDVEFL